MSTANILLGNAIQNALKDLYGIVVNDVLLQKTRKEFEGDLTLVVFPYVKDSKRSPEKLGEEIGNYIQEKEKQIKGFNVVKGFLNIALKDEHWLTY
ncbi:MAG TPA: arginine--tRNA ligase, partial [Bacteroidia bacterium]|nr:arginine--tRNA ligase [Bacteroidia bacterium]